IRQIFAVNANIFIRTLALMFSFAFMTVQSSRLGTLVLAANTLLLNFQTFMAYGLDGFANAAEALVGKAIGARERAGLLRAVQVCLQWSFGVSLIFAVGYWFLGSHLVELLTSLPEVLSTASEYLPWVVILPIISVWSFAYDGIFVGATKAREMRDAMVLSTFGVFVPTWWMSKGLDNHGLWLAFSLFMLARGVFMHLWFRRMLSRGDFSFGKRLSDHNVA
ncbi:MAG: MATE family efflux transporter, partial [Pseudomonadota bacterium]